MLMRACSYQKKEGEGGAAWIWQKLWSQLHLPFAMDRLWLLRRQFIRLNIYTCFDFSNIYQIHPFNEEKWNYPLCAFFPWETLKQEHSLETPPIVWVPLHWMVTVLKPTWTFQGNIDVTQEKINLWISIWLLKPTGQFLHFSITVYNDKSIIC